MENEGDIVYLVMDDKKHAMSLFVDMGEAVEWAHKCGVDRVHEMEHKRLIMLSARKDNEEDLN